MKGVLVEKEHKKQTEKLLLTFSVSRGILLLFFKKQQDVTGRAPSNFSFPSCRAPGLLPHRDHGKVNKHGTEGKDGTFLGT